jgi:hypothetical protein
MGDYTEEQIQAMTDDELDRAAAGQEPTPATPGEGETPPEPSPGEEGQETPPAGEQAPATPEETPPGTETEPEPGAEPEPEPKLLAGKYKSTEDLAKGLTEIGKPLGIHPGVLERAVADFQKSGDWDKGEELYVELNRQLEERKAADAAARGQEPQPAQPDTGPETTAPTPEEVGRIVANETMKQTIQLPVVAEMKRLGVEMPTTEEAWAQLKVEYPAHWIELKTEMQKIYNDLWQEAQEISKAEQGVDAAFKAERETASEKIREFAKENDLGITDEEIDAFLKETEAGGSLTEDRHGVRYPREGAYWHYFLVKKMPELLPKIRQSAEARGRVQHTQDLKKMGSETVETISTTIGGTKKQTDAPKIDAEDRDSLANLSDTDLDREIERRRTTK